MKALDLIAQSNQFFYYHGETFLPGEVPIVLLHEMSSADKFDAELEENLAREDLSWQDRIAAVARSHEMRKEENPSQSFTETAKELSEIGAKVGGASAPARMAQVIREATIVAPHLADPAIAKARNASEAFQLVIAKEEAAFAAELVKRQTLKASSNVVSLIEVRHGDSTRILPQLDSDQFDLILSDPPFAIGVGASGFRSRTVHHHNYNDSPEATRNLLSCIVTEGFRVCKNRANLFLFTDIDLFEWLRTISAQSGWTPWRTPIIWAKSDSEGLAPWGRQGFRRTYEVIFWATKNRRGLISSPTDILRHNRVPREDRDYGAEKPTSLLREIIECSTFPNDYVLDPCCGSGSTLEAARDLKRRALGIEMNQEAFNLALVRGKEGKLKTSGPISSGPSENEL